MDQEQEPQQAEPAFLGHIAGVAIPFAAIWVGLTLRSGVTYHLFPLAIAALPALVAFRIFEAKTAVLPLMPTGLLIVAASWGLLEILDEAPTATLVHDQPGGVPAEVAVLALVGALAGQWLAINELRKA